MTKLSLLYQQKIFMKANTKLYSTQYSVPRKKFLSSNVLKIQMYFELGQENFQSFNHKYKCQSHSSTIKVQV